MLDQVLEHAAAIVAATELPVSADFESGYAETPEGVAQNIQRVAATGLAGCSIEDFTGDRKAPIYELSEAVERVAAAAEAARGVAGGFVLTARAENYLHGRRDLDDTLRRLQAFEAAGADVLYAPGLPDLEAVRTVCGAVSKPVNVIISEALPATAWTSCRRPARGASASARPWPAWPWAPPCGRPRRPGNTAASAGSSRSRRSAR